MAANNVSTEETDSPEQGFADLLCATNQVSWQGGDFPFPVVVVKSVCISFLVLTCPFTVVLNILVILAVKRKRYLKKKHQVLLACLAGTDLLTGVATQPLLIASNLMHVLEMGSNCHLEVILNFIYILTIGASIIHLVIISGERYIAIKHALRHEVLVTTRRLTLAVASAWLFPACGHWIISTLSLYFAATSIVFGLFSGSALLACIITISFCQYAVLRECRRHLQHIKLHLVSESSARELLQKSKASKTTLYIVLAVFLCFLPQIVFFGIVLPLNPPKSVIVSGISVMDVLVVINSLVNPVIYCVRTEEFKRAFREFLPLGNSNVVVAGKDEGSISRRRRQARVAPLVTAAGHPWQTSRAPRVRSHSAQGLQANVQDQPRRSRAQSC